MSNTYAEVKQQPAVWRELLTAPAPPWRSVAEGLRLDPRGVLLFVGSGTSYYLAQVAARSAQEVTGRIALAAPSADVFLSPGSTIPAGMPVLAFVISRSGRTSEALRAAELLAAREGVTVVAISCAAASPLSERAHHAIELEAVREKSVVMTQSFTGMLLALQATAATMAGDEAMLAELRRLPAAADAVMAAGEDFARRLGDDRALSEFVFLGVGPAFGLAEEAMLKMTEMTQTHCVAYNSLEFRHGPISTVRSGTAAVVLNGLRERDYADALVRDLARHGAFVATISAQANASSDLDLVLGDELGDLARSVLNMPALQLMAYYRATALGLDPDAPRNLDHVVVLDGGG